MTTSNKPVWTELKPPLRSAASRRIFVAHARSMARAQNGVRGSLAMGNCRETFAASVRSSRYVDRLILLAAGLVLSDLALQGWRIRVRDRTVVVHPPLANSADHGAEKARVRRQELIKRNAQLAQPSVQAFVHSMERNRLFEGKFVSIFSLMRDGRELAANLKAARKHRENGWAGALKGVVEPYIDFVQTESARCPHTGLRLMDIWRYFRHTWSNQYTSVPGRTMLFIVRDRAAPFHPVVGIGALCSPIMQLRERDEWIGWQPETFLDFARSNPSDRLAAWLEDTLDVAISEIYIDDFVEDKILTLRDIRSSNKDAIDRLLTEGVEEREAHHRFVRQREHRRIADKRDDHWAMRARSHLFRSKRAIALASYLRVRAVLKEFAKGKLSGKELAALASTTRGADAIKKVLRKAKADRVGICVADISVCGAIQPYNAILGGKLVAMLATGPEIVSEYRRRYGGAESEIASAMAGRPVRRVPNLVFLGTTSLYGVGSSQYNRVRVPCDQMGGKVGEELRYRELGRSESFGTSQYADDTVSALTELAQQSTNGSRINSIFGEGVSPKLRKVRQGLELLDLPADVLLKHHRHRIVYGVSLIRNLRDYLLGLDGEPSYLMPAETGAAATSGICDWWRARWLRNRIESDDVLSEVARHTLIRPIEHGARVAALGGMRQADTEMSSI